MEQTRQLMVDLHPVILDEVGLVPALHWYVEKRMEGQSVQVLLETSGTGRRLPSDMELAVFRIVQEAVNNVAKHAQASTLRIEVAFQPEQVCVTVTDDGRGFSLAEAMSSSTSTPRLGLLEMPERAALVHGSVTVDSVPGRGTRVDVQIPLT